MHTTSVVAQVAELPLNPEHWRCDPQPVVVETVLGAAEGNAWTHHSGIRNLSL